MIKKIDISNRIIKNTIDNRHNFIFFVTSLLVNKKGYNLYLRDITAAARDTPEMELKLGR